MRINNLVECKIFPNLKEALESLGKDKRYDYERHKFKRGEKVDCHFHPKANEFIIADQGGFSLTVEGKKFDFQVKNRACVIKIAKGAKHSLAVKSKISYFVFRDRRDKIIYC